MDRGAVISGLPNEIATFSSNGEGDGLADWIWDVMEKRRVASDSASVG